MEELLNTLIDEEEKRVSKLGSITDEQFIGILEIIRSGINNDLGAKETIKSYLDDGEEI